MKKKSLEELIGLQLSSVEFVQDYLQLRFDGPLITVYNPIQVESNNAQINSGEDQFRNFICAQISKIVDKVELEERDKLTIEFIDKSKIIISLKEKDYIFPEAINYHGLNSNFTLIL